MTHNASERAADVFVQTECRNCKNIFQPRFTVAYLQFNFKEPIRRTDRRNTGTVFISVTAWAHRPHGPLNHAGKYYVQSVLLL